MRVPTHHSRSITPPSPSHRIGLWFLSFSLISTCQSIALAADSHTKDDAFWAEATKLFPAFVPPQDIESHPPAENDQFGRWAPPLKWPHIPVSGVTLPDGRVLTWASNQKTAFLPKTELFTFTATWDPKTAQFDEIDHEGHDMFCAHQVMLEDGRVFVSGGNDHVAGIKSTSIFDYQDNSWTLLEEEEMKNGRWYNTSVAMPNGTVFTAIGAGGGPFPEVWTSGSGWNELTGMDLDGPILSHTDFGEQNWWPLLNLAPNGEVFHSGPTPNMNYMNPAGNGTITQVGPEITQWYPKHGTTVMYDEGKLLVAGGWTSGGNIASTNQAMVIDINGPTPTMATIAPMAFSRKFHNGVILPNGEVLVIGGNTTGFKFDDTGSILAPEIWNPVTEEWREVANMDVPRNYHSIAFLLTDGTVLSAGGGLQLDSPANHQDGQVYSPPYLFNQSGALAARPVISSGPTNSIRNGSLFNVTADPGIEQFSLIKMSSTTHAINTDLRYLKVPFAETERGQYELTAHSNINVLSPGYWMLFALNTQDVPSVAFVLRVTAEAPPIITEPNDQFSAETDTVSLQIQATNKDPLTYSATGLPPSLTIDPDTGAISGTLPDGSSGIYSVTVSVTDGLDMVDSMFIWNVTVEGTGQILREWWTDIPGKDIPDLTGDGNYPNNPAGTDLLTLFEGPANWDDNYGTRIRGYLHPITSGDYTFWIASDDQSELRLSTDEFPANAVQIANVPTWSNPRQWTKFPEQQSAAIPLQAGQRYYVEALQKSENGVDHLAVAWQSPDLSQQVIDGFFLSPYSGGAPLLTDPGNQVHVIDETVNLALLAFDPDGDPLVFSTTGLPTGLGIDSGTGMISGAPTIDGVFDVTVSVSDGNGGADSVTFTWTIGTPLVIDSIVSPPQTKGDSITYTANFTGGINSQFTWLFGDGTPETTPSLSPTITHSFANAQQYVVKVTGTSDSGEEVIMTFKQAIHEPITPTPPAASMSVVYEERADNDRLWNVNPDNDTVSVFDTITAGKVAEIPVDAGPRSLAIAPDGRVWVVNKHAATISILDANTLSVVQTLSLPHGSEPFGLVFDELGGHAYVTLEATGLLQRLDAASGLATGNVDVGPRPRHVSVNASGSKVFVSRFISSPLPGEDTASPQTEDGDTKFGGEVVVVDTASMAVTTATVLQHSEAADADNKGRGIPNYLGPAVVSPDGLSAWVASKQDNIKRGVGRDGRELTHDSTVRSITSRIDLSTETEDHPSRIDHDNGGVASTALFSRFGSYLFIALEGSREVAVIDPYAAVELHRFDAGLAPQGLALSPDGLTLYVHNFMDRTITVHDISYLVNEGGISDPPPAIATNNLVASETLSPQVLLGKQLFYDARDPRLGLESYISCAACHNEGGLDGRVWNFTNLGEGFRETINLRGRAGLGHGPLHRTGNFDEVQDFEGQIRNLSKGTGLMSDTDFLTGTRSDPLGDPKTGLSNDLDALAAYVTSLNTFSESPHRNEDGTLTADGVAGKAVFETMSCSQCHSGQGFTDSALNTFHDIGTWKPTSGNRLGEPITGFDTPTLRGLFGSAPYLHDGSATNLGDAVKAHTGITISDSDLTNLVSFLQQIDGQEPAANTPPSLIDPGDQSTMVNDFVSLTLTSTDPDIGDTMSFSATSLPEGLSINGASGEITGIPTVTGPNTVTAMVTDDQGTSNSFTFLWTITAEVNQPPVLTSPGDQASQEGDAVNLTVDATDADRDALTFLATGLPADLSIDSVSGLISGTVSFTSAGSNDVTLTVTDGVDTNSVSFLWIVDDVNQPPLLTSPGNQLNQEGDEVNLPVAASDGDGDPLTFSAARLPNGLSINSGSGLISGTLSVASDGSHNVTITVSAGIHTVEQSFLWTVFNVNQPPVLTSPGDQASQEGDAVNLTVDATDEDGDGLTFLAIGLPPGLSIDRASGLISGTLSPGSAGSHNITISVTDSTDTDGTSFLWTVSGELINQPPVLEDPSDQSNSEGEPVALAINATDADGHQVTFEATGLPPGLSINRITGLISGTLLFTSAGSHNVTVTVTDGTDTDSATFSWNVANVNQLPRLTVLRNQSNQEGDAVNLLVTASDVDGDPLTFSATGLPPSLTIDSGSGLISGTLSFGSAGLHDVTVTVSAGSDTVSASFLWTVDDQPPNINITPINLGIAAQEGATGTGFILYSQENVHTRFLANPPHTDNSDHLISVQFIGGQWLYDNDLGLFPFTPQPTDILIAEVDFDRDTISGLQGNSGTDNGISMGYATGDLSFQANWWNGAPSPGDFTVDGTQFVPNGILPNIDIQPADLTVIQPEQAVFTVLASGDEPITYQWRRDGDDLPGETSSAYLLESTDLLTDDGATFDVIVSNPHGTTTSDVATLSVTLTPLPPTIDTQPIAQTVTEPNSALFSVIASGNEPISYQWRRDGIDLPGATRASYLFEPTAISDNGVAFDVVISSPFGTVISLPAILRVDRAPILVSGNNSGIAVQDVASGTGYILYSDENVHTRFSANPPLGSNSDHWIAVQFDGAQWLYDNNSGLFPFTPRATDVLVAEVDFDADTISGLQSISGTDNGIRLGYAIGDLTFEANLWNGTPNAGEFTVGGTQFVPSGLMPSIDIQPSDLTATQPGQALFSVQASGDEPISYQWRRDGADLLDEASATYLLESTDQLSDDGATFDVVISNPHGTVISDLATLRVNLTPVPPTVEFQPAAQTVTEPDPALFSVIASGNAPFSYQWRRNGTDILGATSASYLLDPTDTTSDDGVAFDVVISNLFGTVISLPAILSVNPAVIPTSLINLGIPAQEDETFFSNDRLFQRMTQDDTKHQVELWFTGAVEQDDRDYRIFCSSDLVNWDDCTAQFRLTQRIVNSTEVPPTVTLTWVSNEEQSSQEFFHIEVKSE